DTRRCRSRGARGDGHPPVITKRICHASPRHVAILPGGAGRPQRVTSRSRWRSTLRDAARALLARALVRTLAMTRCWTSLLMLVVILVYPKAARAWVFHEHTMIGRTAMASLPAADAEVLKLSWAELRAGAPRLCPELWKPDNQFVLGPLREPP